MLMMMTRLPEYVVLRLSGLCALACRWGYWGNADWAQQRGRALLKKLKDTTS